EGTGGPPPPPPKRGSKTPSAVQSPIVVWKMKAPEKKPLVRRERAEEVRAKVRKGSHKKPVSALKALAEFHGPDD
ncbi:hypothetical protein Pcinc_032910, partial [Petrolisthes cinctipes]